MWACILMSSINACCSGFMRAFMTMEDVFLTLSFVPALEHRRCIKNVQRGRLFVQTITPSPKPHRAPVVLGTKDASTPLWDLQCFMQNLNNCMKQQWIWATDGRVCKCLCNEHVCSICLDFKVIVCPKIIILSAFAHLHVAPNAYNLLFFCETQNL